MDIEKNKNFFELVAIEYPGFVKNVDNMVETLGGIQELSKAFHENQKLQLKFHPKNFYNKAIISTEQLKTSGMLLKIKIKRPKKKSEKPIEFKSAELIGTVSTIYKFNNFADYQFLPIQRNEKTGVTEYIYDDLIPTNILSGPSWLREKVDVPLFLPPVQFSRIDCIQSSSLVNENSINEKDDIFKFSKRSSRVTHGTTVVFDMKTPIPSKPKDTAIDFTQGSSLAQKEYEIVSKLFEERPIWTLSSLKAHIKEPPKRLSNLLATIAYHYSTGPWRNCFVRYGYDPRKEFESRFYQMIDYRVRQGVGYRCELKRKRTSAVSRRVKVHQKLDGTLQEDDIEEKYQLRRKEAIFDEDTIPPFQARHYQFADIHVPKIQEMLRKLPQPTRETDCNERRGWIPATVIENVREILSKIAQTNMTKLCKEKNISLEELKGSDDSKSETLDQDDETTFEHNEETLDQEDDEWSTEEEEDDDEDN
ncbi:hypothetical protein PVAND_005723 [Polypedilum vanderplanki]|uniref:General transcription factor 3C polypeptide 5 n=1 Tax=Polypedilum vanderplanki TaxID=319348 RepID=A0A9J6C2X1_POLVA|nr:hypothetical protein PVAND_005723 [Polypedilum vanderplanki]